MGKKNVENLCVVFLMVSLFLMEKENLINQKHRRILGSKWESSSTDLLNRAGSNPQISLFWYIFWINFCFLKHNTAAAPNGITFSYEEIFSDNNWWLIRWGNPNKSSKRLGQDLNFGPPDYKSATVTSRPYCSSNILTPQYPLLQHQSNQMWYRLFHTKLSPSIW